MKAKELHNKGIPELQTLLKELQANMLQMSFDLADKKLKDTSKIQKTKKDIARILTCLAESRLAAII